ncbi:LytTR family DNA-binding domain-containing protein [Phenylobacterium sp. NIBR 498073]|uniref:LytTR family DNA-binding domain-containing protein n=1 Tax=Phenylobacterium sp. NIBR 498073 TaxID=3015177 RepID=UPI0022B2D2C6|nr:LytTR family DNA-binding domain-containing protein [Phenylobacterium sp. NIBR 498073]WGU39742.1 LytTR family DNA-binding domain-containing protein [Phenylobacterium sp. NIBR 498073]
MTSEDASGTRSTYWRAYALIGAAIVTLNVVNMFTAFRDRPDAPPIMPVLEESTSAVSALAFLWIAFAAFRLAPPGSRPVWRMLAVQAAGLLAFTTAHVTGFMLLRMAVFRALDLPFRFDLADRFVYELRKDAFGYLLGMAALWAMIRLYGAKPAAAASTPATFDIRDGARVLRSPAADILAATSAGNYVEFILADGRKPLMRASLTAIEAQLAPLGFVRTHRSWLVNAARVTELRPEKSGDYAVRLGDLEAPLSRRFPEALARLRGG